MKKLVVLVFCLISSLFAQVEPEFQGFAGNLLRLKKAEKGYHSFSMELNVPPWAFSVEGEVKSPGGDPDVLFNGIFDEELIVVMAYIPYPTQGKDGNEYQTGMFDLMIYLQDEKTQIRNLSFNLLPPANDSWAKESFEMAKSSAQMLGPIWNGKFEKKIIVASATPLTKKKIKALQKKMNKK